MATRARDTTPPAKRGTSPIHPQRTSKTTSPVGKPTTSNNKNIPSYLKPTLASSRDTNNNTRAKKSASSSDLHNNKPALTRRLSFDRPPLPCSSPKTRISPNPKERILRSSSSSLSAKQKPLLDRFSKTAIGKQRGTTGLQSRPVTTTRKKTTTTTTITRATRKHDSTTTKAPIVTDSQGEHSEPEDHQELTETEKEMIISDNEMAVNSDVGDNDSAVDDHEELNGNVSNNVEPEDIKAAAESSSIVVETQEIRIEEAQEKVQVEEPEEMMNEAADDKLDSSSEKEKEEIATNESEENQEPKEEEEGTNQEKEVQETEAVQQQEQEEEEEEQHHDAEEVGESSEAVVEKNREVATSKAQAQVVQQGKKEGLSNDVIEETASRLREQRKNKVRALASAFETVISLQHPK